jgi:hypothetical protein
MARQKAALFKQKSALPAYKKIHNYKAKTRLTEIVPTSDIEGSSEGPLVVELRVPSYSRRTGYFII